MAEPKYKRGTYKKVKHICKNDQCGAEFEGTASAVWCKACRVNSKRIRARMIKDGTWTDKA